VYELYYLKSARTKGLYKRGPQPHNKNAPVGKRINEFEHRGVRFAREKGLEAVWGREVTMQAALKTTEPVRTMEQKNAKAGFKKNLQGKKSNIQGSELGSGERGGAVWEHVEKKQKNSIRRDQHWQWRSSLPNLKRDRKTEYRGKRGIHRSGGKNH